MWELIYSLVYGIVDDEIGQVINMYEVFIVRLRTSNKHVMYALVVCSICYTDYRQVIIMSCMMVVVCSIYCMDNGQVINISCILVVVIHCSTCLRF